MSSPDNIKYILSDDTRYDVTKLKPVVPGDEYYLLDEATKNLIKVGDPQVKEIFTHSIDELVSILNQIIQKNLKTDFSSSIKSIFDKEVASCFGETVKNLKTLKYMGEFSSLPEESDIGSVYRVEDNFYLFYERKRFKRILTIENVNDIIKNYYTKDETDALISGLLIENERHESLVSSEIEKIENESKKFVTKDIYNKKILEYNDKINQYREDYEGQISSIRNDWNDEIQKMTEFKRRNQKLVDKYENDFISLLDIMMKTKDDYQNKVDKFSKEVKDKLAVARKNLEELKENANEFNTVLNNLIISYGKTTEKYDKLLDDMSKEIETLSSKIDNLVKEEQRILNS